MQKINNFYGKNRRAGTMLLLCLIVFLPAFIGCAVQKKGLATTKKEQLDQYVSTFADAQAPGFSLAVVSNGRVVYHRSVGFANPEKATPAGSNTNYRLASVTKQFTAFAILQLASGGKLSLEDPLRKFFPQFPAYADSIRVRHLLNHISGLVDYEDLVDNNAPPVRDAGVLQLLVTQDTTYFTPGARYSYSNSGYSMLALIIEKVSGKSFADYITTEIFTPLQMSNCSFNILEKEIPHRAYGYAKTKTGYEKADQSSTSFVLGDGGIYASIDDMAKWSSNLVTAHPVLPRILELANTNSFVLPDSTKYGCGWRIDQQQGVQRFAHSGSSRGFRTWHAVYPEKKLGIIVLTNTINTPLDPTTVGTKMAEILLQQ